MKLKEICALAMGIPVADIHEATGPASDHRWNSLAHLKLVAALEDAFEIRFSQGEIKTLSSVATARALLQKRGVALS
jgi:acyl carrier protein